MFENVDIVLSLLLAIAPAILALAEHFLGKCRTLFLLLNTLYFAAACLFLLMKEGTLACLLIALSASLAVRLLLEIFEGRKEK
ncbi:MAG: hypothetical protein IJX27_07530 [Clostridia bacterium]|nr:hypothetical protein [Clostridia bacterium]